MSVDSNSTISHLTYAVLCETAASDPILTDKAPVVSSKAHRYVAQVPSDLLSQSPPDSLDSGNSLQKRPPANPPKPIFAQ